MSACIPRITGRRFSIENWNMPNEAIEMLYETISLKITFENFGLKLMYGKRDFIFRTVNGIINKYENVDAKK